MPRKSETVPKAPLQRVLIRHGAKRVSDEALEEFANILWEIGEDISKNANEYAKHAGRKTILVEDLRLASKKNHQ